MVVSSLRVLNRAPLSLPVAMPVYEPSGGALPALVIAMPMYCVLPRTAVSLGSSTMVPAFTAKPLASPPHSAPCKVMLMLPAVAVAVPLPQNVRTFTPSICDEPQAPDASPVAADELDEAPASPADDADADADAPAVTAEVLADEVPELPQPARPIARGATRRIAARRSMVMGESIRGRSGGGRQRNPADASHRRDSRVPEQKFRPTANSFG